jgi:ATP-dependent DNA helicase RecQ
MKQITFIDTEVDPNTHRVIDIGAIKKTGETFHSGSTHEFSHFIKGTQFICGHNILNHDLNYIGKQVVEAGVELNKCIDTLYLSPLFFPKRPYHALLKDDKLQVDETNNPLNDAIKAKDLFHDLVAAFNDLSQDLRKTFYLLLNEKREFKAFFEVISYTFDGDDINQLIEKTFKDSLCEKVNFSNLIQDHSIELAYCLALIHTNNRYSITPKWVLKNYPDVTRILNLLRNKPCIEGCNYCNNALDIHIGLKENFGFDSYRNYGGEPLQEKAVKAAIDNKSILAVFPTGGGKSITFQVPALMSGKSVKGLTVVISPLQSLMKDQVDNLERIGITEAVTINGMLDPIERGKSFERVEDGSASLLYISPESLRSKTIERLLLGRNVVRFIIDEAHCFSSWGQDFRVDYLYIGDFIKSLQEMKNLDEPIPISCFTATAKLKVIEDIVAYFKDKLSLDLELFSSSTSRENLTYSVFDAEDDDAKYESLRNLLEKGCPTIIYVSRTRRAYLLAEKLTKDGFNAKPYHGKMDVKEKNENQNAFIAGNVQIIVATSAFGMGVDKKDVGMVIHYEISDSLENYIQEAGRAGRDEHITADCYVLFNEEDLSKHFILLNQTKLSIKEIQQVWKAIKEITKFRSSVSNSALEIARKAGWDDSVVEIETRVTTAIAALEASGYLKRGQNMPCIFANSIVSINTQEAIDKINSSARFNEKEKENGIRIIKKLFASKSRKQSNKDEVAEARIDYISDHLGIVKGDVIQIITLLRQENILADAKDLTAFIKKGENKNKSLSIVQEFSEIENFLFMQFEQEEKRFQIKELNEKALRDGYNDVNPHKIKTIINFWAIKNWIKRQVDEHSGNHITVIVSQPKDTLNDKLKKRHELAGFIVELLYTKSNEAQANEAKEEVLVEFSVLELKDTFEKQSTLFGNKTTIDEIEDALFFLSRIEAIKIEGGFLVVYNKLTVERLEQDNRRRYKAEDYEQLDLFYKNKVQQIHIVGEYAKRMIKDYQDALQFVDDYFKLNYYSFLNKYFPGSRQDEIKQNITPAKFRELFGTLSPRQLSIVKDKETKYAAVLAGPGSGKTRVLVHKLASLLLMEDEKHEQLLMLTFSRAAATEFKQRLFKLIGNAAHFIEIKTFHSYCFDLLGRVGTLEKSDEVLKNTIEKIKKGEVEISHITKMVLVIDEAQDMDADEFTLINTLIDLNDEMRVIAVGDDDQNIYEFRGASSKYLKQFYKERNASKHELIVNFRSKRNLVAFSNAFLKTIPNRLKEDPITAHESINGTIKIVNYKYGNLAIPLVNAIRNAGLSGTTCVLTRTNNEASLITALLLKNGISAKLIQSNEGFNLFNLAEIRFFLNSVNLKDDIFVINDEAWENAIRELNIRFKQSTKLEASLSLLKAFELTNPKRKYKSDLEVFIRESNLEDFFQINGETIFVSTLHKAKGKEFDNVFIMLENFDVSKSEYKRLLYVGMTRAKKNLSIHLNGIFLDGIEVDNLEKLEDNKTYLPPNEIVMHLGFKDVWLDYFITKQHFISDLQSGDVLHLNGTECLNSKGEPVLVFSKKYCEEIERMKQNGFNFKSAKVNFVIYWKKEGNEKEVKVILPELLFSNEMTSNKTLIPSIHFKDQDS